MQHYEASGCILTPETFLLRPMTRQEILARAQAINIRRYGDTIFQKGQATSYEGPIDIDDDDDDDVDGSGDNRTGRAGWRHQKRPKRF